MIILRLPAQTDYERKARNNADCRLVKCLSVESLAYETMEMDWFYIAVRLFFGDEIGGVN